MIPTVLRYGALMFAGFTVFFLLMHVFGLSDTPELRMFNGIIHLGVLWLTLRAWLRQHPDYSDNYAGSVALGLLTTGVGAGAFSIFLILMLSFDPSLMAAIKAASPPSVAEYLSPVMTGVVIFSEATAVGLIGSFIIARILETLYYRSV